MAKIPMTRILTSLFGYPSYHMDSKQTERTVCGRMLTFSLPAGHILHIAPLQIDGARLNMQIEMFDGDRPRLGMHALMENRATLILGGPHYQLGMMIVMVNVHIVGSLPPAPPQIHLPHPKIPPAGPSPNANAPVPDAGVPSMPGGISPISTHP
ncbi:MAG TPA: hypothetical protein VHY56_07895 [Candidatus Binataceae bacterium]|nr:hypothetical protein [Candidatus Binataceae bacterium]